MLRDHTAGRIRGRSLQRINAEVLRKNPLCVRCQKQGRVTIARVVDHITPLAKAGRPDSPDMPRQGLCVRCHEIKTAEDFDLRHKVRFGPDGNPIEE